MQRIKIAVKKAIRKTWKRMPFIVLITLICGFTLLGVISASEKISNAYYENTIAPLISNVNFTK